MGDLANSENGDAYRMFFSRSSMLKHFNDIDKPQNREKWKGLFGNSVDISGSSAAFVHRRDQWNSLEPKWAANAKYAQQSPMDSVKTSYRCLSYVNEA